MRDGRFWIYPWVPFEIFSGTLYNEAGLDPVIAQVKRVREVIERDGEQRGGDDVARTLVR